MQRIISFLLLIVFLCPIVCQAGDANQPEQTTKEKLREKDSIISEPNNSEQPDSIIEKAQQGDADAQYTLGLMYYNGKCVPQDYEKAAHWYTKAAKQGLAIAQHKLGWMYYRGEGVTQDYGKAVKWFRKAAQQGDADAQYTLGVMYEDGTAVNQDYNKAVEWYTKAAQQSHAEAQYNLGVMYYGGEGVPQDDNKGVEWFTKAAQQGDTLAQAMLDLLNYFGKEAVERYTKAAQQGDAKAQYNLGVMYSKGEGVTQDYNKAAEWFTKAAQQGFAAAQYLLGLLYAEGKGGVPQDYGKAVEWYRRAAEQGFVEAQHNLGVMYSKGEGVPQDYNKAAEWCRKAAEQGLAKAQYFLGSMYFAGRGVIEDYVEAYKWTLLAVKNGCDYSNVYKLKTFLKSEMTVSQVAQAQQLAKEFVAKKESRSEQDKRTDLLQPTSYGTGFFVSSNGYVVTAAHIVENATRIKLFNQNTNTYAQLVYKDEAIDVAVLKADKTNASFLPIISSSETETGDEVFTLGFPQIQIQGIEPKYTEGSINALSGMGGNRKFFQISIPVQPGNSGGPMLNSKGQVVGVIATRLDEIATLKSTGSIPQNVNYAIKSSFVLPFLDTLSDFEPPKKEMPNKRTELITEAKNAVVLVICY